MIQVKRKVTDKRISQELLKIKVSVSKLAILVLKCRIEETKGDDSVLLQPFVNIENAIEEEILKLKL